MIQRLLPAIILCFFALASQALAHEIRPAFLQIDEVAPQRYELLWKVPTRDGMVQNIRPAFDQGLTLTPVPGETLIGGFVLFRYSLTGEAGLPGTELHIDGWTVPQSTRWSVSLCGTARITASCSARAIPA